MYKSPVNTGALLLPNFASCLFNRPVLLALEYPDYKDLGKKKSKGTGKRQRSAYKLSKAPVFSGDLLNDFQLRKTNSSGFSFGTVAWGSKVKSLANLGREISRENKALPKKIETYIMA